MISRREFLQVAAATAAIAPAGWSRSFAQQRLTQADLLRFEPVGNVTLVHLTDIHAQLMPVLFREPSTNIGVGEARTSPAASFSISTKSRPAAPPPMR
jgi:sulfur-oxidizing protein SoxB